MKQFIRFSTLFALSLSLLFLCACSHEAKFVGTWQWDGTQALRVDAPFEFADRLVFRKDGTLTVTVDGEEQEFRYVATDDTLTIQGDPESYGVPYTMKRDALSLGGRDAAPFTKVR